MDIREYDLLADPAADEPAAVRDRLDPELPQIVLWPTRRIERPVKRTG